MPDKLTPERRSWNMARIRSTDTAPEKAIRSILHSKGYRFRLHDKDLPGTPDIVLPKYRTIILVHGCFWHRHEGCKYAYMPKSNMEFWNQKFRENVERDTRKVRELQDIGWQVIIIWECEVPQILKSGQIFAEKMGNKLGRTKSDRTN